MSAHIYEDPDEMLKFKYGKRDDRNERLEREVDIYEASDVCTDQVDLSARDTDLHTQDQLPVQRHRFRGPALIILALLCLLLAAGLTVFYKLYVELMSDNKKLMSENEKLTFELERMNCRFRNGNQTEGNATDWRRFQCSCYYISTERRNWMESREECMKRGADLLVIKTKSKHEFYRQLNKHGEFWIGLQTKDERWSKEWQWVDRSSLEYTSWNPDAKPQPADHYNAFMDLQGTWMHASNGSKHWICERDISV